MSVVKNRAELVRRKIDLCIEEQHEPWKIEHDKSMACFALQEMLGDWNQAFLDICRLDEAIHERAFSGQPDFDPNDIDLVVHLFRKWLDGSRFASKGYELFETEYAEMNFDREVATIFQANVRQCLAILNPSQVESDLADEALASHRRGETVPMDL
jgi:hypothetical protein